VAIANQSSAINSTEARSISDYRNPDIEQFTGQSPVKRVPRQPEPPEKAATAWEEPESQQASRWEAPDAGFDDFASDERGLSHGRSRG
jgi:hypothetical protein